MSIKKGILLSRLVNEVISEVELITYHQPTMKSIPIDVKKELKDG